MLLAQVPADWTGISSPNEVSGDQAEARELLVADWDIADGRHRSLIILSIRRHSQSGLTDWARARADYLNRSAAVAIEDQSMRQMRVDAINRQIRRENGHTTITTTCRSTAAAFYPSVTTTCTTTED